MKKNDTKKVFLAAIICPLFIFAGAGLAYQQLVNSKDEPIVETPKVILPLVNSIRVEQTSKTLKVFSQGIVEPLYQTEMTAIVEGKIIAVDPRLKSGGVFEKGETMLEIDSISHLAVEARAFANLTQAQLNLEKIRATANQALLDWKRLGKGPGSPLVLHKPQLKEAQALVGAAKSEYEAARQDVKNTRVKAPYDCRVDDVEVSPGQHVAVGDQVATVFSTDVAEVRLPVRDEELAFLTDGPWHSIGAGGGFGKASLFAKFGDDLSQWDVMIIRSEGVVNRENQMIYLVAEIAAPYEKGIPAGLYVKAEIFGKVKDNVFVVPLLSVVDGSYVYVIDPQNRLHRREVNVVQQLEENVLISTGLVAGEVICTSSLDFYFEGMQVKLKSEQLLAAGTINEK